jgi:predicted DNA-binding protein (UPF0251 family)
MSQIPKGRRKKVRYIQKMPQIAYFSPRGKAGRPEEIELKLDQFEAVKISDYQGYSQLEGAKFMGISRPSFGRILNEGRRIVAEAISTGKILKIRMGDVQIGIKQTSLPKKEDAIQKSQTLEQNTRVSLLKISDSNNSKP